MNYPLISEYIEAIKAAEENFSTLTNLQPVLDDEGNPIMSSGNFAVVFKMKNGQTGKLHAVKCFLKEQKGRAEAYRMIAEELEYVNSTFLTPIKYLDKELFVDSKNSDETEFPVLLMDWVEGMTLDKYIQKYVYNYQRAENLDETTESEEKAVELLVNGYELEKIAYQFSCLAIWLLQQPFAHGDLKPDNILVKEDGTLVLVDYDGMYVPAMKGQKARELGSPDFRHPLRNENEFDEHIDDFPLSSILLSLLAIANEPSLLEKYGGDGRLLLSERDYRNIAESEVLDALRPLMADKNLTTYLSLFYLCSAQKSLFKESYHLFTLSEPEKPYFMVEDEDLSTEVTAYDWNNRLEDEYGGVYSYDGRKLLAFGSYDSAAKIYKIKDGTRVICDLAFNNYENDNHFLKAVRIPSSVTKIGKGVFAGCTEKFIIICDSPFFEVDTYLLYDRIHRRLIACLDSSKRNVVIDPRVDIIGAYCFSFCETEIIVFSNLVKEIEEHAIDSVDYIIIPSGMKTEFEKMAPMYKEKFVEQEDGEGICLAYCSENARACEDQECALWQAHAKIIKKNDKIGVVIDDGTSQKQIIPFIYDTWFNYDGYETEIEDDFFEDYFCHIGYFAIKNPDGTFTMHGYDKEGTLTTSFTCDKFNTDSFQLKGKWFLRYPADGVEYDNIRRMGYYYGQLGNDNCYFSLQKGNKCALVSSDLKHIYIDYTECDGFKEIGWTPKGYYAVLIKGENYQLCIGKKDGQPLILHNEYEYITKLYCMNNDGCGVEGLCFSIRNRKKWAVCSNDLQHISPFIFDSVESMINENEVKVTRKVNDKSYDFVYKINNYNGWKVKNSTQFSSEDIARVLYADVITTKYGLSVRFKMKDYDRFGKYRYIPLSAYSTLHNGDVFDMTNAIVITLCREGEDDIYRVLEQ